MSVAFIYDKRIAFIESFQEKNLYFGLDSRCHKHDKQSLQGVNSVCECLVIIYISSFLLCN